MSYHTTRSDKLLKKCAIFLHLLTFASAILTKTRLDEEETIRSEPLKSAASEHVGKILNVPVSLNFNDEPLTRGGRGFYGGHRRNDDEEEQKINDGQFGRRIILGIVHNEDETTTHAPDQKRSQTIVKYFDKEDYGGIKTNPIVVGDHYADVDADHGEKTRSRKEILALKQEKSPLIDNEDRSQKNEDESDSDVESENEDLKEPTPDEDEETAEKNTGEQTEENTGEQTEEHEDKDHPAKHEEDTAKYTRDDDDTPKRKYEEYKIPPNHKETYTEVEYPDNYGGTYQEEETGKVAHSKEPPKKSYNDEFHQEEPSEKLTISEEPSSKDEDAESKYTHHKESIKASDVREHLPQKDQKGSADHSHEEVKKKKKGGKHASGKGEEKHEEHHGSKGDKGEKKYEGYHEEVKGKKGHHDEVKHGKKYADKGGEEKKHHEEHGHHGDYHKGEKGEKGSKFSEEGKHSKGHSTKGEHNIHKKDEYEKNQEFYDEHHEGGEHEKHGGFHHEDHYKKGGHKKVGHHKKGDHEDHYGKKSHHEGGHFYDEKDGKKKATGHNQHHSHHAKHGKKNGNSGKKYWGYKKGSGGGGGHKKKKEGQHAAHSNLQQVKKAPPAVHEYYKEDGKYPHYIGRFHVSNGNRRSDTVDDKEEIISNQKIQDNSKGTKQNFKQVSKEDVKEEEKDIIVDAEEEQSEKLKDPNSRENTNISKEDNTDNEELDHDYLPESSILHEQNKESPKNASKPLPKIYVILPKDFEEQLQRSAETFDSSSIERESSYEDSEEEKTVPKIQTIHKKYTKLVEPVEAQSFPEEHKKRLSEIEYVIHKIGAELGKNMKDKGPQVKLKNKSKKEDSKESDKFSFSEISEET